jgi:hypothetical protein
MNPSGATPHKGVVAFTRWFSALLCLAFAAGGAAALWHGLAERDQTNSAQMWPVVEAKVLCARVKTNETKTANKPGLQFRRATHQVMVSYSYTVGGKTYTGVSAAPRQITDDEGWSAAQAIADSYTTGSPIVVYYRSERPSESQLSRIEVTSDTWFWYTVAGGLAIPISLLALWWSLARSRRERQAESTNGTPPLPDAQP